MRSISRLMSSLGAPSSVAASSIVSSLLNVQTRGASEQAYEQLGSQGTAIPTLPQNFAAGGLKTSTIYRISPVRKKVIGRHMAPRSVMRFCY